MSSQTSSFLSKLDARHDEDNITSPVAKYQQSSANSRRSSAPFTQTHNRRAIQPTTNPKPEKRKTLLPLAATSLPKQKAKPRASAPSRIPAPVVSGLPDGAANSTPPRAKAEFEKLMKTQAASLNKMTIKESKNAFSPFPLGWEDDDDEDLISPSTRRSSNSNNLASIFRHSSEGLEHVSSDAPPPLALHIEATKEKKSKSTFQRQVSHAHVLFGGPAIATPTADSPKAAPVVTKQYDDDDDSFFKFPSPNPGVLKKFKPRDSGVVVSEDSDDGFPLPTSSFNIDASSSPSKDDRLFTPAGVHAPRKSNQWIQANDVEPEQSPLRLLLQGPSDTQLKDRIAHPATPIKKHSQRLFSSLPRARAALVPPKNNKGRKSMPSSHVDFQRIRRSSSPHRPGSAKKQRLSGPSDIGRTPLSIVTSSIEHGHHRSALSTSSSSGDSLATSSTRSSIEDTPTRYQAREQLTDFSPLAHASDVHIEHVRRPAGIKRPRKTQHMLTSPKSPDRRFTEQFIVTGELGKGEFGEVNKVYDKVRNKEFAVKRSKRYDSNNPRKRLIEEVEILKTLNQNGGHVNVLGFVDSWDEDEHLYIQTVLCGASNLHTFLNDYGENHPRLEEAYIWKIVADVSNGLLYIHSKGVIHLDIKPANILVSLDGRMCIGDFGMASAWPRQVADKEFEREGDRVYMAPEILQGVYGKAADVFSFGMLILEATTNIVVPDMGTPWHKLRNENFEDVQEELESTSAALLELIRGLMRTDPGARLNMEDVFNSAVVGRAREWMETRRVEALREGRSVMLASPLAKEEGGFIQTVLGVDAGLGLSES